MSRPERPVSFKLMNCHAAEPWGSIYYDGRVASENARQAVVSWLLA